jgi:hypothetical protein
MLDLFLEGLLRGDGEGDGEGRTQNQKWKMANAK